MPSPLSIYKRHFITDDLSTTLFSAIPVYPLPYTEDSNLTKGKRNDLKKKYNDDTIKYLDVKESGIYICLIYDELSAPMHVSYGLRVQFYLLNAISQLHLQLLLNFAREIDFSRDPGRHISYARLAISDTLS